MAQGQLIDLDELVLRCRNEEARKYINEAVMCYKAGAFRACVVSTWIAVVYDFIDKLRQLARLGDKNAQNKLNTFESARREQSPAKALDFEKSILGWSVTDFEFISRLQRDDLERLLIDRNRCAHPSMISEDEIYEPTAEVARYHLRNAITHFLEHPPVQGKAALESLSHEVLSLYFPRTLDQAIEYLSNSALRNAKPALVRNFVALLLKEFLLLKNFPDDFSQQRMSAAICATRHMYRIHTDAIWKTEVNNAFQQLPKENMSRAAKFLYLVPDTWEVLNVDRQILVRTYINDMPDDDLGNLAYLMEVAELRDLVVPKLPDLNDEQLVRLTKAVSRKEYLAPCIELYGKSNTIAKADYIATDLLIPLASYFEVAHATQIVLIIQHNPIIVISTKIELVLELIRDSESIPLPIVNEVFEEYETQRLQLAKDDSSTLLRKSSKSSVRKRGGHD